MRKSPTERWGSPRIELFLLEPRHATERYAAWLNDPVVNRYLESRFMEHTVATTRDFVQACLDDPYTLFLGIASSELQQRHVGNIKLAPTDFRHGLGEIGIMIGDNDARGRGIGPEAIRLLAGIAKYELGLRKLTAGCYASNEGSVRAFLKADFEIEARRRQHFLLDGHPEDLVLLARWL